MRTSPAPSRPGEAGRWVVRPRATSMEEYVDAALDRIRTYGAHYPEVALTLLSTILMGIQWAGRLPVYLQSEVWFYITFGYGEPGRAVYVGFKLKR